MSSIAKVQLIFTIALEDVPKMHNAVNELLKNVGVIDFNILVYLALNELTLGRTISHTPQSSMDHKIPTIFPQYNPVQHAAINKAVHIVASYVYKTFFHHLDNAHISTPAWISQAGMQQGTVNVIFSSHEEERPWVWQYSTLPQS